MNMTTAPLRTTYLKRGLVLAALVFALFAVPANADPLMSEPDQVTVDIPPSKNLVCFAPCTGTATAPEFYESSFTSEQLPFEPDPDGFWSASIATGNQIEDPERPGDFSNEFVRETIGPASNSTSFTANTLGLWKLSVDGGFDVYADSVQFMVVSEKDRPAPIKIIGKKKRIKLGYVLKVKSPKDTLEVTYTDQGIPSFIKKSKCPKPKLAGVRCFKLTRTQFGPNRRVKFEISAWNKDSVTAKLREVDRVADIRVVKYTLLCRLLATCR